MSEGIDERIRRLYTAIGETVEDDLSKFIPVTDPARRYFQLDFRGDMTPEEMTNTAHAAVAQVAGLRDHLRKWAKHAKHDVGDVDAVVDASPALKLLIDVWNAEKHGYPPSGRTLSGKAPRLGAVDRALAIGPGVPGAAVELTPSPVGLDVHGPATMRVTLIGPVVDADGTRLGELSRLLEEGLKAWEVFLQKVGLV
jgi:hypothetical protein